MGPASRPHGPNPRSLVDIILSAQFYAFSIRVFEIWRIPTTLVDIILSGFGCGTTTRADKMISTKIVGIRKIQNILKNHKTGMTKWFPATIGCPMGPTARPHGPRAGAPRALWATGAATHSLHSGSCLINLSAKLEQFQMGQFSSDLAGPTLPLKFLRMGI